MKQLLYSKIKLSVTTLCLLLCLVFKGYGQTPTYFTGNVNSPSNSFPFNQAGGKAMQSLVAPGEFTGAVGGFITKFYVQGTASINGTWQNLIIRMGQTSATTLPTGALYTGTLTTVFNSPMHAGSSTAAGWLMFTLQTPFRYDPTQSLVIEISQCASTGGFAVTNSTRSGFRRTWNPSGCIMTYSNQDASLFNCGIDVLPPATNDLGLQSINGLSVFQVGSRPVSVTVKNWGLNQVSNCSLNWVVNGVAQPPVFYSGLIDTIGGSGSNEVSVTLGNYTFANNITYNISAWTSSPNGGADTVPINDTAWLTTRSPITGGTYTIGAGGDFFTITQAANVVSTSGVSGPVTFTLTDDLYSRATGENFPANFINAAYPITIKPSLTSNPLITDSTSSIINVDGSAYFTIDGRRNAGDNGRNIMIENRSTSTSASVVRFFNDATGGILRNTIIRGSNNTTTVTSNPSWALVHIGGTNKANAQGNDSITVFNNLFARAQGRPYSQAVVSDGQGIAAQNNNIDIDSNWFQGFTINGVHITNTASTWGNGSNFRIRGNSFYDTLATIPATTMNCINFVPNQSSGSNNNLISGNFIGGQSAFTGSVVATPGLPRWEFANTATAIFNGITVTAGAGSGTIVTNNIIRNFRFNNFTTTSGFNMINHSQGTVQITNNIIGMETDTNNITFYGNANLNGITCTTTNDQTITGNSIRSITARMATTSTSLIVRGILTQSSTANVNVNNNVIAGFSVRSNGTGSTTSSSVIGIAASHSSGSVMISNNTIGGSNPADSIVNYSNTAGTRVVGITAISNGIYTVTGNTIRGLTNYTNAAGTTTSANLIGISMQSSGNGQLVTNNTIDNLQNPTSATHTMIGILSSSGAANINNNTLSNFYSNSTYTGSTTGAAINGICVIASNLHTISNNTVFNFDCRGVALTQINGIIFSGSNSVTITNNIVRNIRNRGYMTSTPFSICGIIVNTSFANQIVSNNTIHSLRCYDETNTNTGVVGIYFTASSSLTGNNNVVNANNIHSFGAGTIGFPTPGSSFNMYGIWVGSGNVNITNNMIRLGRDSSGTRLTRPINLRGIYISTGGVLVHRTYHNSVYIESNPLTGAQNTAAYEHISSYTAPGLCDIENNIFVNKTVNGGSASGLNHVVRYSNAPANVTSNHNIMHNVPAANNHIGLALGLNRTTMTNFKAGSLTDGSSANVIPGFLNDTGDFINVNLRLSSTNPAEGQGDSAVLAFVNTDFDGTVRTTWNDADIGADAGNFTLSSDSIAPGINYTALINIAPVPTRTLTATIYDKNDVAGGANLPRVYFRKGLTGPWASNAGTLVSGNTNAGTWDFVIDHSAIGGVVVTDTIYYFVAAQDVLNSNLNSNPMYADSNVANITVFPVTPRSYNITDPIATLVTVGTGGTYATLTGPNGLFDNISKSVLQGNTTVEIISNITEPGNFSLNRWNEVGAGNYSLTIRPASTTQRIVSGTFANTSGLIRLNGCSRVNILGYPSSITTPTPADTFLVIRSSSTSTPSIGMLNATNTDSVMNVILESRSTIGVIYIQPSSALFNTGVYGITIEGNHLRQDMTLPGSSLPTFGLYAVGTTPRFNSGIRFANNQVYNFTQQGISVQSGNGNNWTITGNHLYHNNNVNYTSTFYYINFVPGQFSDGNIISNNWLGGTGVNTATPRFIYGGTTLYGIMLSSGLGSGTTVSNNILSAINAPSASITFYGMFAQGTASVYNIDGNRIGNADSTISIQIAGNTRMYGIYSQATGNISVTNNQILNLYNTSIGTASAITGIQVFNGSANNNVINGNTIKGLYVNSTNTGTLTAAAIHGIYCGSSSTAISISNNTVNELINNNNTATHCMIGILNSSGIATIANNTVRGMASRTTNVSTAGTAIGICGIMNSATSSGVYSINNNTVDSIWYTGVSGTQMMGIYFAGSSAAIANMNGNTVRNMNSSSSGTGTTTSSAIIGIFVSNSGANQTVRNNTVHTLQHWNNTSSSITGILYTGSTSLTGNVSLVDRNFVHSFRSSATSGIATFNGIFYSGFSTISNNMIRLGIDSSGTSYADPRIIRGITINTSIQNYIYHNSILITGAPTSGGSNTSALELLSTVTTAQLTEIKNNILANTVSNSGSAFGINYALKVIDTLRFVSNYNLFYAPGVGGVVVGTNLRSYPSLSGAAGWKDWSRQDLASAYGDPMFNINAIGTADVVTLALQANTPAERSGDPSLTAVSVDYFGNARSTLSPSDIGAHAGNFNQSPDIFPPVISFTPLTNTGTLTGSRTLSGVTIADNNGIPMTGANRPALWYSKDGATWYSSSAVTMSGTASNATASFVLDYTPILPLTVSDTIRYYVIAQDNAGNVMSSAPYAIATSVSTITAHPVTPNIFTFLPIIPANTVFQVGVGQTYTSLSGTGGFFEFINSRTLGGNITAEITSNLTETGAVPLTQFAEDGAGGFNLVIRPASGTVTPLVLQGSASSALIRLNGADRVKLSGIPTNGGVNDKMLLVRNNGSGPAVEMQNATQGVRLHNCIFEANNGSTTSGVVSFVVLSGTVGNTFDTVSNCIVRNNTTMVSPNGVPAIGIYANGFLTTLALNSNLVFTGNEISNFNYDGIFLNTYTGDNNQITNNSFYNNISNQPTNITTYAIFIGAPSYCGNNLISGNFIGGSAANCGGTAWTKPNTAAYYGIYTSLRSGANTIISNNTIRNIVFNNVSATAQFLGVYHIGGDASITNNTIGSGTGTGSITFNTNTTHYGIFVSTSGAVTIDNNTVGSMVLGNPGLNSTFYGIYISSGNLLSLNNNLIGSTTTAQSIRMNGIGTLGGIFTSVAANLTPTYAVTNNTIANLDAVANFSSTLVRGIILSGNSSIPTFSGNIIRDLNSNSTSNNTSTAAAVVGIQFANSSNVTGYVNNNTIYNLSANDAGTSPTSAIGILISSGYNVEANANRIYDIKNASTSLSTNPAPVAAGISVVGVSTMATIQNNQISLGNAQATNTQFNGIWIQFNASSTATINAFNNSVVISGVAGSGSQSSFAFVRGNNTGTEMATLMNNRNNIYANIRSGGSGKHYAIANQTNAATNNTWNASSSNHNLLVSANASTLGLWGVSDVNLTNWVNNATSDFYSYGALSTSGASNASSLNLGNLFANIAQGNLNIQSSNAEVWYVYGKGISGSAINNLNTDFAGVSRNTNVGYGITIGANQLNAAPSMAPIAAGASAAPSANSTSTFTFGGRVFATINWGTSAPTTASLLPYTGVVLPGTVPSGNNFNQYNRINVSGGTAPYNYGVSLTYDPAINGAVTSISNLKVSTEAGGTIASPVWSTQPLSSVNTTNRTVTASGITSGTLGALFITGTENAAPPTISGFTPNARQIGGAVTIRGSLFTGASAVSFNGTSQPVFTVVNDTAITTTVPVGATTGTVSVTNPYGTGVSTSTFTIIPAPTVTNLSSTTGTIGSAVTITGTGFTWATQVQFNTTNATFTVVNNTTITCNVPSGATTGLVTVTNPAGSASSAATYVVIGAPTVSSLAPTSGPVGTTVTITGTNFQAITGVTFNGVSASYTVNSPTQIVATVPSTTTGTVSVTNGSGTGTSAGNFTVVQLPTITGFSPTSGSSGTTVIISGTNFSNVDSVEFGGGANAVFTVNSTSQITATVPSAATTGNITVYTSVGNVISTGTFTMIPDLIVSTSQNVSGTYNNITVTGTGDATLTAGLIALGNVTIQTGGAIRFGSNILSGNGSFTAQSGSKLYIGSTQGITATGGLTGNVQMGGARSYSSGAVYTYDGVVAQVTGTGLPASVDTLVINDTANVTLSQTTTVNNSMTFINGKLLLANSNLTINGSLNGVNATSYFVTANTPATGGMLRRAVANNNTPVTFPIGGASLTPVQITLTAGSTADVFGVRVFNGVYQNGTSGAGSTGGFVNRTWVVSEQVNGGSVATVNVNWDDTMEVGGFTRANCGVFYTNAGGWVPPTTFGAATGSNPFAMSRSGMTTFGAFSVGDATSSLPVQLVELNAARVANDIVVNWSTASEINNSHFEIERSTDGVEYTNAGRVDGQGYSASLHHYQFVDANAALNQTNVLYYRLKQVDFDGKAVYLGPVAVQINKPTVLTPIQVFPNPFNSTVTLNLTNIEAGVMKTVVTDMQGRIVYSSSNELVQGLQHVTLEFADTLKDGVYFMTNSINGNTVRTKLIKAGN